MDLPTHMLVPIDFSETSEHALTMAASLAKVIGAKITLMHAFELPLQPFPDSPLLLPQYEAHMRGTTTEALEREAMKLRLDGLTVDVSVRIGNAWEQILDAARITRSDMIVLGTHGRSGLDRWIMGSVAERVVRMSKVPVLTVRHDPTK